jgi:anti-anti-sigma factor
MASMPAARPGGVPREADPMSNALLQVRPELVDGVLVVDMLPREITEPEPATRLGEAFRAVFDAGTSKRMLINAEATKYLSSTAFAVLLRFGIRVAGAGGKLAICCMDDHVRIGANIIRLGDVVPILPDERTALAALNG